MAMNSIHKALLTLPLLLAGLAGCASTGESEAVREANFDKILGHWSLREVNNGVLYDVRFNPDSTLDQHFKGADGHERVYPGFFSVSGDTLRTDERRNLSTLIITELTDSTLVLVREDSTVAVFDRIFEEQ